MAAVAIAFEVREGSVVKGQFNPIHKLLRLVFLVARTAVTCCTYLEVFSQCACRDVLKNFVGFVVSRKRPLRVPHV